MRTDTCAEMYKRPTRTGRDAHDRQSAREPHVNPRMREQRTHTRVSVSHPRRGQHATSFTAGGHGNGAGVWRRGHGPTSSCTAFPPDPARPLPAAHPRERSCGHKTPLGACSQQPEQQKHPRTAGWINIGRQRKEGGADACEHGSAF